MPENPLEIIKTGILQLKSEIEPHRQDLLAWLSRREKSSDADEMCLDHDRNLVNEAVVELLENTSDYKYGLSQLNSQQTRIVEQLKELGGGWKHMYWELIWKESNVSFVIVDSSLVDSSLWQRCLSVTSRWLNGFFYLLFNSFIYFSSAIVLDRPV